MKSSRKIWSVSIALAVVLLFASILGASQYIAAQTSPSVDASKSVVAPTSAGVVAVLAVRNYSPVEAGTPGPGTIVNDNVMAVTERELDAAGDAVAQPTGVFTAEFFVPGTPPAQGDPDTRTAAQKINRIVLTSPTLTAGHTYTVKVTARYDTNITVAATDDTTTIDVDEAGGTPAADDDRDGSTSSTVTVHVPTVQAATTFQVEPSKVVNGEIISRVGRDRDGNPLTIDIVNLGPATATVAAGADPGDDSVTYTLIGGNKIQVKSAVNNLAAAIYNANVSIARGDVALDDVEGEDDAGEPSSSRSMR